MHARSAARRSFAGIGLGEIMPGDFKTRVWGYRMDRPSSRISQRCRGRCSASGLDYGFYTVLRCRFCQGFVMKKLCEEHVELFWLRVADLVSKVA